MLLQTMSHCVFLLQSKNHGVKKCEECEGGQQFRIGNPYWKTFQKRMQMDRGFGATKYMTLYSATFDTYYVIAPRNMHLDDENVVKTIGMESILVEALVRSKINRICIEIVLYMPKLEPICFW